MQRELHGAVRVPSLPRPALPRLAQPCLTCHPHQTLGLPPLPTLRGPSCLQTLWMRLSPTLPSCPAPLGAHGPGDLGKEGLPSRDSSLSVTCLLAVGSPAGLPCQQVASHPWLKEAPVPRSRRHRHPSQVSQSVRVRPKGGSPGPAVRAASGPRAGPGGRPEFRAASPFSAPQPRWA